jgi:hypothetical protein
MLLYPLCFLLFVYDFLGFSKWKKLCIIISKVEGLIWQPDHVGSTVRYVCSIGWAPALPADQEGALRQKENLRPRKRCWVVFVRYLSAAMIKKWGTA